MTRTTIVADDHVIARLKAMARKRGISFSQLVREALEEKAREFRPKPKSIGVFSSGSSGRTDIASTDATERVPPRSWR
ncbi:MAG TPA: CopG family transcriptional regulator [Actinomycetota bacterium]